MIPCPHCTTPAPRFMRARDYNLRVSDADFDYYRCPRCGLVFLHPIPANLSDYYSSDYFVYARPTTLAELEDFLHEQEANKLRQLTAYKQSGSLLDIGAGYGGFAYRAKKAGFAVDAIEMNEGACRFLDETAGVAAYRSDDPAATLSSLGTYDVITLWHVIEHLTLPFALLAAIADHLRPGGIVMIAAPNPQSFQFSIFRSRWKAVDAPRHLTLIPAPLITGMLAQHGLKTLLMDSHDANSRMEDYVYWHEQFTQRFSQPALKRAAHLVGAATRRLLTPLETRGFGGSSYIVVVQKPNA